MAVSCSNCGGSHPVWDCRTKSTAALTEVQHMAVSAPHATLQKARSRKALPVDTNPVQDAKATKVDTATAVTPEPAQEAQILRPGPKFDKKEWSRDYMRIFMRQYRAEVKAGTRIPKRKGEK